MRERAYFGHTVEFGAVRGLIWFNLGTARSLDAQDCAIFQHPMSIAVCISTQVTHRHIYVWRDVLELGSFDPREVLEFEKRVN
jgi:hypothetical protein